MPAFLRALIAFLALPGTFGALAPWLIVRNDRWRIEGTLLAWPILAGGICIVLWCVRDFYVFGKGTLAPWDPPKRLVIVGLYRFVRNPMYVGVLGVVAGWAFLAGSPLLGIYTGVLALAFHLRVIFYEEVVLARQFTQEWAEYRASVNRWLPKIPAGRS